MGFIRKVYTLMSIQLLVTTGFVAISCNFLKEWITKDPKFFMGILIASIVGYFVTAIPLLCCKLGRVVPINYILLTLFTLCLSTMVGFIAAQYDA